MSVIVFPGNPSDVVQIRLPKFDINSLEYISLAKPLITRLKIVMRKIILLFLSNAINLHTYKY